MEVAQLLLLLGWIFRRNKGARTSRFAVLLLVVVVAVVVLVAQLFSAESLTIDGGEGSSIDDTVMDCSRELIADDEDTDVYELESWSGLTGLVPALDPVKCQYTFEVMQLLEPTQLLRSYVSGFPAVASTIFTHNGVFYDFQLGLGFYLDKGQYGFATSAGAPLNSLYCYKPVLHPVDDKALYDLTVTAAVTLETFEHEGRGSKSNILGAIARAAMSGRTGWGGRQYDLYSGKTTLQVIFAFTETLPYTGSEYASRLGRSDVAPFSFLFDYGEEMVGDQNCTTVEYATWEDLRKALRDRKAWLVVFTPTTPMVDPATGNAYVKPLLEEYELEAKYPAGTFSGDPASGLKAYWEMQLSQHDISAFVDLYNPGYVDANYRFLDLLAEISDRVCESILARVSTKEPSTTASEFVVVGGPEDLKTTRTTATNEESSDANSSNNNNSVSASSTSARKRLALALAGGFGLCVVGATVAATVYCLRNVYTLPVVASPPSPPPTTTTMPTTGLHDGTAPKGATQSSRNWNYSGISRAVNEDNSGMSDATTAEPVNSSALTALTASASPAKHLPERSPEPVFYQTVRPQIQKSSYEPIVNEENQMLREVFR